MKKSKYLAGVIAISLLLTGASSVLASSHREAPLISGDPKADATDLFAFRSPDATNTVTLIAKHYYK